MVNFSKETLKYFRSLGLEPTECFVGSFTRLKEYVSLCKYIIIIDRDNYINFFTVEGMDCKFKVYSIVKKLIAKHKPLCRTNNERLLNLFKHKLVGSDGRNKIYKLIG